MNLETAYRKHFCDWWNVDDLSAREVVVKKCVKCGELKKVPRSKAAIQSRKVAYRLKKEVTR